MYSVVKMPQGVANHHPEKKSTVPKFFARPKLQPRTALFQYISYYETSLLY